MTDRPDVLVAIDFPDFNFRLARTARALGVPVVYYISPQLWAWRPGRIRAMKAIATKVLVIFPFEEPIYERAGVPVEFVGHPLIDLIRVTAARARICCGARPRCRRRRRWRCCPGSRPNEVRAILPVLAGLRRLIRAQMSRRAVRHRARAEPRRRRSSNRWPRSTGVAIVEGRTDDVLNASDVVLTASGTATVQTALHERPMVIVYRLSPLTYRLGGRS